MRTEGDETQLGTTEARGASTPGIARYVLGVSLAAIVIIFAAILLIWR